jgi:hypothetical protein
MAQEYCQALYTAEITSTSTDEQTVLTIDGTNIGGLTDDYAIALEVVVIAIYTAQSYSALHHRWEVVERRNGSLAIAHGTPESLGAGLADTDIELSGNNILIRATPSYSNNAVIRAFVRILGVTTPIS